MLTKWLAMAVSVAIVLCACSENGTEPPPDNNDVVLEEIDDVLPNPFKGFVPWVGIQNPIYQTKLQYKTFEWIDLEPIKGQRNWSALEQNWGNIALSGKRVGIRVSAATPGSGNPYDIPEWLVNEGVSLRGYSIDGHQGLAPDWDDPKFLTAHRDFIMALGDRYNNDPRIAWIDIGSYGFWGEWHVYLNDSLAATEASKQEIIDAYFDAFPDVPKVIAFDDDFATEYVTNRGGGIRNDCLGTKDANDWYMSSLNSIDPTMNDRVWKTAIITGEFCGSDAGAIAGTTSRFDLNFEFVKQTHWSFIGTAGGAIQPQDEAHRQNLDRLHKTLGYRFVLKAVDLPESAGAGADVAVTITLENKGIAPFYFEWPLVVYLMSADGTIVHQQELSVDIGNWLPGSHTNAAMFNLPQTIAAGTYEVRLAIHDPQTGAPGLMFANTGNDGAMRYLVDQLTVN